MNRLLRQLLKCRYISYVSTVTPLGNPTILPQYKSGLSFSAPTYSSYPVGYGNPVAGFNVPGWK